MERKPRTSDYELNFLAIITHTLDVQCIHFLITSENLTPRVEWIHNTNDGPDFSFTLNTEILIYETIGSI